MNERGTAGTVSTLRAHDVRETFTAEQYETELRRWNAYNPGRLDIVSTALYIAAQVMRPGVIEDAIAQSVGDQQVGYRAGEPFVLSIPAAAIRKALLGEAEVTR